MLPTDWAYGKWPRSGEIDIMEQVGYSPDSVFGTVHTEAFNHIAGTQVGKGLHDATLSSQFHTYSIIWDAKRIQFLMDDKAYLTFDNRQEGPAAWPFDQDFHMILNLAVGGNWGGRKGVDETIWPRRMLVDYVRVYQAGNDKRSP
jgi:beta-glucanase (GH16 family)